MKLNISNNDLAKNLQKTIAHQSLIAFLRGRQNGFESSMRLARVFGSFCV